MNLFYKASIEATQRAITLIERADYSLMHKDRGIGAGGDISSGLDLALENIFVEYLGEFGVIESEESGVIGKGVKRIILDPLDGSSNALSGFPYYGVSIARLNEEGILKEAFVSNFANGDIFFIDENGYPKKTNLKSLNYIQIPRKAPNPEIGLFEKAYAYPKVVEALDRENLKFRAPGAVALSLAYASSVNYFLYIGDFRIYDFTAGLALCRELEVVVEDKFVVIAHSKDMIEKLLRIIAEETDLL